MNKILVVDDDTYIRELVNDSPRRYFISKIPPSGDWDTGWR
jgi:hypothetical protein